RAVAEQRLDFLPPDNVGPRRLRLFAREPQLEALARVLEILVAARLLLRFLVLLDGTALRRLAGNARVDEIVLARLALGDLDRIDEAVERLGYDRVRLFHFLRLRVRGDVGEGHRAERVDRGDRAARREIDAAGSELPLPPFLGARDLPSRAAFRRNGQGLDAIGLEYVLLQPSTGIRFGVVERIGNHHGDR